MRPTMRGSILKLANKFDRYETRMRVMISLESRYRKVTADVDLILDTQGRRIFAFRVEEIMIHSAAL